MKKKHLLLCLLLIIVLVVGSFLGFKQYKNHQFQTKSKNHLQADIPTLFVHGFGSSYHAEEQMVNAAKDAGVTQSVIRADIEKNGDVNLIGKLPKNAKNPIVEVNFKDKNVEVSAKDVKNVVQTLCRQYDFKQINFVGHSVGNLAIANYINENYNSKTLPKINKVVSIAGHYNGWLGEKTGRIAKIKNKKTGEPDIFAPGFKRLLPLRKNFPKQIQVLNIYGDLDDGSHSDGSVSVASAQTYKYLINNRAKSYREVELHGKNAQHSKLHENKTVDKEIIRFLWHK